MYESVQCMAVVYRPEHGFAMLQFVMVIFDPSGTLRNGRFISCLRPMQLKVLV